MWHRKTSVWEQKAQTGRYYCCGYTVADHKPKKGFHIKKYCWWQCSVPIFILFSTICIHERFCLVLTYLWNWYHIWCDGIGQPHRYVSAFFRSCASSALSTNQHLPQIPLSVWRQKDQRDLNILQKAILSLLKAALYSSSVLFGWNCTSICRLWVFYAKTITFDKMKEWCFLEFLFCCSGDYEHDIGAIN